jgi:SPP1 gp7 family putative phage head morphogenesis protein
MLVVMRGIIREGYGEAKKQLRSDMIDLAKYEAEYQAGLFSSVGAMQLPVVETLAAVVTERPLQGFLLKEWSSQLEENAYHRIEQAIRIGFVEGESVPNIAKRIRGTAALKYRDGVLDISRRGAESLVRTAVTHVAVAAKEEFYAANPDVFDDVYWSSVLDRRTSPICRARDGKVFPLRSGPRPPAHLKCRSTIIAILRGEAPPEETYQTWLQRQPVAVQDDILGPSRGRLFRQGGVTLDRFVDQSGREYTLDELRRRESASFEQIAV